MTSAAKSAVALDVEETRQNLEQARISVKRASARFDELSKTDKDLLARSCGNLANVRDPFKQKQQNAPYSSPNSRRPIEEMLERHLIQAERHVAVAQEHVSRQHELVTQLKRDRRDASDATRLLELFEELQEMHIAHRDRLIRQLGKRA